MDILERDDVETTCARGRARSKSGGMARGQGPILGLITKQRAFGKTGPPVSFQLRPGQLMSADCH
jgi:hypothetical protein